MLYLAAYPCFAALISLMAVWAAACNGEPCLRQQTSLQQQLTHQASHDAPTGLANRALLFERLEHALARSATGLAEAEPTSY